MSERGVEPGERTGFEVAVIGMAGKFPGAGDINEFWENLKNGIESIVFLNDEELKKAELDEESLEKQDYIKSKGGILADTEYFDAVFFEYIPLEAELMDPQSRFLHECAWTALEEAGYDPGNYRGSIGIYAGSSFNFDWNVLCALSGKSAELGEFTAQHLMRRDFLCSQAAYKLNLRGPAVTMQTACSTSLVAICAAYRALLSGECDMALAGGVSIGAADRPGYIYEQGMILSRDGHCRAFDAKASGTVGGRGIGIVVLKLLEEAQDHRDHIYAVIKGAAVNNDGTGKIGYSAPGVDGQAQVITAALHMAEVPADTITYIESHGTGTILGDPIEIEALKQVFNTGKRGICAVGSVKTNIGHLDAAAGAAGFIKTVLALNHRLIPPSLHFETPNPKIGIENSPFYVNTRLKQWKNNGYPLRAGVSSFGIGGTNAHVVLEEWSDDPSSNARRTAHSARREHQLILLSARSESALDKAAHNLAEEFKKNPRIDLADAAYTLQVGRKAFEYRRMCVSSNKEEAIEALKSQDSHHTAVVNKKDENRLVVFMFPGLGAQHTEMGKELYEKEPLFQKEMDRCLEILYPSSRHYRSNKSDMSYKSYLSCIDQTQTDQPLLFAFEYSLAKLLMAWGIKPDAMIGYSFGEYTAACLAGVFSLEEALELIVVRSRLIEGLPPGAMLSVPLAAAELEPWLDEELSIAIDNGLSCVAAGPEPAIDRLEKQMKKRKLLCMRLQAAPAIHSKMMEPIAAEFKKTVDKIKLNKPHIPYISNVTGDWLRNKQAVDPGYWVTHLKERVRFAEGVKKLLEKKASVFIEVGPGRDISGLMSRYLDGGTQELVINLTRDPGPGVSEVNYLLKRLGLLWLYGVKIDWTAFAAHEQGNRISLPTYPFERRRYWLDTTGLPRWESETGTLSLAKPAVVSGKDQQNQKGIESRFSMRLKLSAPYEAPASPMELRLAGIWQRFFGIERIGIHDNFFELGGDSLKGMALVNHYKELLGEAVEIRVVFDAPTIAELAAFFMKHYPRAAPGELKVNREKPGNQYMSIDKTEEKEYYKLSYNQERLWFLHQKEPTGTAFNMPGRVEMKYKVEETLIRETLSRLISRHESFRTGFRAAAGEPVQYVMKVNQVNIPLRTLDISSLDRETRDRRRDVIYRQEAGIPFDLRRPPLFRCVLVKLAETHYELMFSMHHIITDAWSNALLIREFPEMYQGCAANRDMNHAPLELQYKDFAEWNKQQFTRGKVKEKSHCYWREKLEPGFPIMQLPMDTRGNRDRSTGANWRSQIHGQLKEKIKRLADTHNASLFMVMFSAYLLVFSRFCHQEHVACSIISAGRHHLSLQPIIGFFVNAIPFEIRVEEKETFSEFLAHSKNHLLAAIQHQNFPLELVVEELKIKYPDIPVAFNMINMEEGTRNRDMQKIEPHHVQEANDVKYDINGYFIEYRNGIDISWNYKKQVFNPGTIEYLAREYIKLLEEIVENPSQPLKRYTHFVLRPGEIKGNQIQPANDFIEIKRAEIHQGICRRFEARVKQYPDNPAVKVGHQWLTYDALNRQVNRVAHTILKTGKRSRTPAALLFGHGMEMVIGLMGALKSGRTYVPLDPDYPLPRLKYMLADSAARLIITDAGHYHQAQELAAQQAKGKKIAIINISAIPGGTADSNVEKIIQPRDPAYILYTSGSTGQPKGVLQNQENVLHFARLYTNNLRIHSRDRLSLFSSYGFDAAKMDIYGALLNGALLYPYDLKAGNNLTQLPYWLKKERITIYHSIPTVYRYFTDMLTPAHRFETLRFVVLGGEAVYKKDVETYQKYFPGECILINGLGPTESTVTLQYFINKQTELKREAVPVGYPVQETEVLIINENNEEIPVFAVGEIVYKSPYLALGYVNQPGKTAERFCLRRPGGTLFEKTAPPGPPRKNFLLRVPGRVLQDYHDGYHRSHRSYTSYIFYKSGDLGRRLPDGSIEYVGRKDMQVKVRGYRIEPGEIEAHLDRCQGIRKSVVVSQQTSEGENYLAAYYTKSNPGEVDEKELERRVRQFLPGHMIPDIFLCMEEFPLTPTGKIDKNALPAPGIRARGVDYIAPREAMEKKLAFLWSEVLKIDIKTIGMAHNFFELGGHSLNAVVLITRIHKELDVLVPIVELFKRPTIEELSRYIHETRQEVCVSLTKVEKKEYYPLSSTQERLYFIHRLDPASVVYNLSVGAVFKGEIDKDGLNMVFRELVQRHESFRTSFEPVNKKVAQRIHHHVDFEVEYYDVSEKHGPGDKREAGSGGPGGEALIVTGFMRPFDLSRAPLFRTGLIKTSENHYILVADMHHIITDGMSMTLLRQEFIRIYQGQSLPGLSLQYRDYAQWQHHPAQQERMKSQQAYWQRQFEGEIPEVQLPLDYPRPMEQSFEGDVVRFEMGKQEIQQLDKLAAAENATIYMVLLAAFYVLLAKISNQEDIIIGTAAVGRRHADLFKIVGMFANTIAMRNYPGGEKPFTQFLKEVRKTTLEALDNQEYPFDELVQQLRIPRSAGRNPLFDVMMAFQHDELPTPGDQDNQAPEIETGQYYRGNRAVQFDWTFHCRNIHDRLYFKFDYRTRLFKSETIRRFAGYYQRIIDAIFEEPGLRISEIDIMSDEEKREILGDINRTWTNYPRDMTIHELFAAQVEKTPHHIAVVGVHEIHELHEEGTRGPVPAPVLMSLTYKELNQKANQLAHLLKGKGVKPDTIVAIMLERSIEMIIGIMGILKAGGAYLPIETGYPRERINYMLNDSGATILITRKDIVHSTSTSALTSTCRVSPANLAYVIYTSGTTGKPKGNLTTHANVIRVVKNTNYIEITKRDRLLQLSNYAFDGSVFDIYGALLNGAGLVMIKEEEILAMDRLAQLIQEQAITVFFVTTALFNTLVNMRINCLTGVRKVLFGGEMVSVEYTRQALNYLGRGRILHVYGPTETTVYATYYSIDEIEDNPGTIPIGKPIANTTAYILSKNMTPVPFLVSGELYIGGEGVARGYLNSPELTADRFQIPNKSGNYRSNRSYRSNILYRTGDLTLWQLDGNIVFLGRIDTQVKIRGFRIEPGEIENRLRHHHKIKDVVVIHREKKSGGKYLCAYFVAASPDEPTITQLKVYLAEKLPDYMIPAYFIQIEKIPLTPNGKIDKRRLSAQEIKLTGLNNAYAAPANEKEKIIANIWKQVLQLDEIGVEDNFFEIGGTSLDIIQINQHLIDAFTAEIPVVTMFRYPTVRSMALYLTRGEDDFSHQKKKIFKAIDKSRQRQREKKRRKG